MTQGVRKRSTGRGRRVPREVEADNPVAVREAALKLLERMRRTRWNLDRKLRDKGYAPAVVEKVLDRLAEVGLIDDVEYARAYLAERWGRRAAGWRRLALDLRKRGVAPADIEQAREHFEAAQGQVDEVAGARRVIAQTASRYARLEPRVRKQRLWALLGRRGFDAGTIQQALAAEETGAVD